MDELFPLASPQAAVALIEVNSSEERFVLILRRAFHPADPWSGHLAFPGGRKDAKDSDLLATCLREVKEECGLALSPSDLVEKLPIAIAGRSHGKPLTVQPWKFQLREFPSLILEEKEIQSAFWVPYANFTRKESHVDFQVMPGLIRPAFLVENIPLWGFTYGVLCEHLGLKTGP